MIFLSPINIGLLIGLLTGLFMSTAKDKNMNFRIRKVYGFLLTNTDALISQHKNAFTIYVNKYLIVNKKSMKLGEGYYFNSNGIFVVKEGFWYESDVV